MIFGREKRKIEEAEARRREPSILDEIRESHKKDRLIWRAAYELGLIRDYPDGVVELTDALITPGMDGVHVHLAAVSDEEVLLIADKLDLLLKKYSNEEIAILVLRNFVSILDMVRIVKSNTKHSFSGGRGMGNELDMRWLEPYDVGGPILNPDGETNKFLYCGTEKALSWYHTFHVGTNETMIPEQIMHEDAGVIHLGMVERESKAKIGYASWIFSGIRTVNHPTLFKSYAELQVMEWEYPIIVLPEKRQGLELVANDNGSSRLEMLSLLVLTASLNTDSLG